MTATAAATLDEILYGEDENADRLYTGDLEVMGTWEVAHYLGIERSRVARWLGELENGMSPIEKPKARVKAGPLWRFAQVRRKAEAMYRDAKSPYGPKGLDRWLEERRDYRAGK